MHTTRAWNRAAPRSPTRLLTTLAFASIAAIVAASHVGAAQVYRWVDKNGVVQYSDVKPATAEPGEVEQREVRTTAPVAAPAPPPAPAADAAADPAQAPSGPTEEQLAAQEAVRAHNCDTARKNLELLAGRFKLKDGETGNFLDDAGRTALMARSRQDVADNC